MTSSNFEQEHSCLHESELYHRPRTTRLELLIFVPSPSILPCDVEFQYALDVQF